MKKTSNLYLWCKNCANVTPHEKVKVKDDVRFACLKCK